MMAKNLHFKIWLKDRVLSLFSRFLFPLLWLFMPRRRDKITIGMPRNTWSGGPNIFLSRLHKVWEEEGSARTVSYWKRHDISLQASYGRIYNGRPFVLRLDGLFLDAQDTLGSTSFLNRRIFEGMEKASGVIFISDFCRKQVGHFHRLPDKPVTVIHNAVDTRLFSPEGPSFREKFGKDYKYVVCSAAWRPPKRLGEIIRCFRMLNRKDARLIVLGKPDVVENDERIIYAGHVHPQELPAWYRTGHVFVHLTYHEHCGNSPLEAMACGLPIVAANGGGLPEVVRAVEGGTIVDTDEPYDYSMITNYAPPPIMNAERVVEAMDHYLDHPHRGKIERLDIRLTAAKYREFIEKVFEDFLKIRVTRASRLLKELSA